ncbi:DUF4238 domain-containing protein [Paenibacillus odorifer]|uniref:DUF4238 domain-containing protein n=1 Tax=Paenibacillus odorifer TaxID=189426 RepID=A0A1R0XYD7_9BACL|nr:DUF4238 domain-containing protein [Paenibacillus odorifer]OMD40104.1 hypothetical protein BSK52_14525 [Paenibacillus odorifer]
MKDNKKNQHLVPQTYLKNFAEAGTEQVYLYDKVNKYFIPRATNVRNTIARRYWYDIKINLEELEKLPDKEKYSKLFKENSHKQINEKILGVCEDHLKKILASLNNELNWNSLNNWFNRYLIYQLVAIQMIRTVAGKKMLREMYSSLTGKILDDNSINILLLKELLDILMDDRESVFVNFLFGEFNLVKIGEVEEVEETTTNISLITSDNPVSFIQNFKNSGKNALYYPLSIKHALILTRSENPDYNSILNEEIKKFSEVHLQHLEDSYRVATQIMIQAADRYKNIYEDKNNVKVLFNEKDVAILNSLAFVTADQYIVSNSKLSDSQVLEFSYVEEGMIGTRKDIDSQP